jgi:PPE-repeat protein
MSSAVRIDPAVLTAAGSKATSAAEAATERSVNVTACAPDTVSVEVSSRLARQVHVATTYTVNANRVAQFYGLLLDANATSYAEQEAQSAAALTDSAGLAGIDPAAPILAGAVSPNTGPVASAGEAPCSPRDIARLMHTGPGTEPLEAAAASLRADASHLDSAAAQLDAAIGTANSGWQSDSAGAAVIRMQGLRSWYQDHAVHLRGLAGDIEIQVVNFQQAKSQIPTPQAMDTAERELRVADDANRRSAGRFKPAVAAAQANLSRVYQAATSGYSSYTAKTAAVTPRVPTPPPPAPAGPTEPAPTKRAGADGEHSKRQPARAPKTDPGDSVKDGGVTDDITAGEGVDSATDQQLLGPLMDPVGGAPADIVPTVIGGLVGGLGGLLGGLAGAGQKALGSVASMPESGLSALSGLTRPNGGSGGGEPQTPETPGGGDFTPDAPPGGSGGSTEPAGAAEPLAAPAPAGMGSTPIEAVRAVAAPATSTAPVVDEAAGTPMGMMPPFMGSPRGGQSGPTDSKLYGKRRLRIIAPPNSEPVKGRVESRGRHEVLDENGKPVNDFDPKNREHMQKLATGQYTVR